MVSLKSAAFGILLIGGAHGLFGFGSDCDDAINENFKNQPDLCGMIFDGKKCKEDDPLQLRTDQGYYEFPTKFLNSYPKTDDAESLIVRPGCVMIVWDKSGKKVADRGKSVIYDATARTGSEDYLIKEEFDDDKGELDEEIDSAHCFCGEQAQRWAREKVQPIGSKPATGSFLDRATSSLTNKFKSVIAKFNPFGDAAYTCEGDCKVNCNGHIAEFNSHLIRTDFKSQDSFVKSRTNRTCAILFDDEKCEDMMGPVPEGTLEYSSAPIFGNANEADSVLVRPGCKLTGYDEDGLKGNREVIDATASVSKPVYKKLKELEDRINSVKCECDR